VRLGGLGSAVPRGRHARSRAGLPRYHLACRPARPGPATARNRLWRAGPARF